MLIEPVHVVFLFTQRRGYRKRKSYNSGVRYSDRIRIRYPPVHSKLNTKRKEKN